MIGVRPSFETGYTFDVGMSQYPQLREGLIGAWDMSLGHTGERVIDYSGNGRHGTHNGALWKSDYLDFNGNSYVALPTTPLFTTGNWSLCVEFKCPAGGSTYYELIGKWDGVSGTGRRYIMINTSSGLVEGMLHDGTFVGVGHAGSYNDEEWHTAIMSVTNDKLYLYIDGTFVGSDTHDNGLTTNAALTWNLGGNANSGSYLPAGGGIRWASIYNRALTTSETRLLYELKKRAV